MTVRYKLVPGSTLVMALALSACATAPPQPKQVIWAPPPAKTSEAPPPAAQPLDQPGYGAPTAVVPEVPAAPAYPRSAEEISGGAVLSLLQQAQADRAAGRYEQAAAGLERGLRIEARNYFLWAALAQVYLAQGQFDQAQSVAQKSNSLARGNVYVELENWKTIAGALQGMGDAIGALQAQARVDELQRGMPVSGE